MKSSERLHNLRIGSQSGASLIAILVGLVIGLIAIATLASIATIVQKQKTSISNLTDRESLKNYLQVMADCPATLAAAGCPGTQLVALYKKGASGVILAEKSGAGTKVAKWTVRAECGNTGGLLIKAATLSNAGLLTSTASSDFMADPVTGQVVTWNSAQANLYPSGVEFCQPKLASVAPGGCGSTFCPVSSPNLNFVLVPGTVYRNSSPGYIYEGTVQCPSGHRFVGGAADCQLGPSGYGGHVEMMRATAHGDGWYVRCNASFPNPSLAPQSYYGRFAVQCVNLN